MKALGYTKILLGNIKTALSSGIKFGITSNFKPYFFTKHLNKTANSWSFFDLNQAFNDIHHASQRIELDPQELELMKGLLELPF